MNELPKFKYKENEDLLREFTRKLKVKEKNHLTKEAFKSGIITLKRLKEHLLHGMRNSFEDIIHSMKLVNTWYISSIDKQIFFKKIVNQENYSRDFVKKLI